MKTLSQSIQRFWFSDAPAERLAALRIVVGLFSLGYLLPRLGMLMDISRQGHELFEPVGIVGWLENPLPPMAFLLLVLTTLLANLAFLLGWRFRLSGPLFGILLLTTLCYRNSWSMIFHNDNILVLHALILGLTPAADAWSLDSRRKAPGSLLLGPADGSGWQYGWPVRLMGAVALAPYLLSGIAKLAGPMGLAWVSGHVMRDQIAVDTLRKIVLGTSSSDAIYTFYHQSGLFLVLGLTTMIVELGAPVAFFHHKTRWAWAILAFLMHWGILFMMDITFRYQLFGAMFACFFPVEHPARYLKSWLLDRYLNRLRRPDRPIVQVNQVS